jgi:hypothetical protein
VSLLCFGQEAFPHQNNIINDACAVEKAQKSAPFPGQHSVVETDGSGSEYALSPDNSSPGVAQGKRTGTAHAEGGARVFEREVHDSDCLGQWRPLCELLDRPDPRRDDAKRIEARLEFPDAF